MQSQVESKRLTLRTNRIVTNRPDSSQLVDLHVYIIPKKVWKNRQNLAENQTIEQAISAGFVRVPENLTIHDLRRYIIDICDDDNDFPKEFIYLRSVGRCLTKVKYQQEKELKVKNYRPPMTFAPEIYILDQNDDDDSSISKHKTSYLSQESSINSQNWIRPMNGPPLSYPLFNHNYEKSNSKFISSPSVKLSPRNLIKLREEQERLYLRQIELADKRHEIQDQHNKQIEAAIKIQTAFRNYHDRQKLKQQQQQQEADAIERLQNEARELNRRKTEEEQAHNVVRFPNRLDKLKAKRIELEANRELVVRRMQQLHTQIHIQRREEKDLWKQKYIIEKNQTKTLEEQNNKISKNSTDIHNQLEEATIRLNNTTKLRQKTEYECRLLRQELQQISSTLNALERHRLPKESYEQQQQQTQPISLDITLQY